MSRRLSVMIVLLALELGFPSPGACEEENERARHSHSEDTRSPAAAPAGGVPAPTPYFPAPASGSAASGGETPSAPAAGAPGPGQPDFCQHTDLLRYDFGFGGLTSGQAPMSFHRLLAMRDCNGVMVEHTALQSGAAPGEALWQDRIAYVFGFSRDTVDNYLYVAHTTAYGIQRTRAGTLGWMATEHTFAPLNFEFMANAPIRPIAQRLIFSDRATYAPDWSTFDYEAEIGARLESRHAALRAGYHITKMNDFRRSGFYIGYSLMF